MPVYLFCISLNKQLPIEAEQFRKLLVKFLFGVIVDAVKLGKLFTKFLFGVVARLSMCRPKGGMHHVLIGLHCGTVHRCHCIRIVLFSCIFVDVLSRDNPDMPEIFQEAFFNSLLQPDVFLTGLKFSNDGLCYCFHKYTPFLFSMSIFKNQLLLERLY